MPPSALAACTTVGDQANALGVEHADFADVWTASGYPCGPSRRSVTLQLVQIGKRLIARGTQQDECIAVGDVVFRATLPTEGGVPLTRLPLSVPVELTLGGSRPRTVNGHLNLQSADEMQLDAGDVTLGITRKPVEATTTGSAGVPAADSGMSPEAGGETGGQPEAGAADSGMPAAGDSSVSGTGGTGGMEPSSPVAGGGGAGASGSPAAGGGGASGMVVSEAKGAAGGTVSGAGGASGMPAAGSGPWSCTPFLTACVCVHTAASTNDTCNKPKPPCCFRATVRGEDRCQCWPENSSTCLTYRSISADARKVASCPPQD